MATNQVDREGWHKYTIGGEIFTLPDRYENPESVGQGAFGAVIKAHDRKTQQTVAIKKLVKAFDTPVHAKRTYRELKLLTYLKHPNANIVQLYDVFTPETDVTNFRTLYFVLNYAGLNLKDIIRPNIPFDENHIKTIIYPLLRGLKFMHSAGIVHRDLKPHNIGVDPGGNVYILDFGLARILSADPTTVYVTTRWWRAPEVCISDGQYNANVDIWAVGCIMAQLVCLQSIFCGNDNLDQLKQIFELTGIPDAQTLERMGCTQNVRHELEKIPNYPPQDFHVRFALGYQHPRGTARTQLTPEGIDFLRYLLEVDPDKRPSAAQAIAHPYLASPDNPVEEPIAEVLDDPHSNQNYSTDTWKNMIWNMIQEFTPST